jgi:hypothetical protein
LYAAGNFARCWSMAAAMSLEMPSISAIVLPIA